MKALIVEDDFMTRKLMARLISRYGECDVAVNGEEAIAAYSQSVKDNKKYDLICLDILMPGLDGHQTLKKIRGIESATHIRSEHRVKVIMTTVLSDSSNVMEAFNSECEAYLIKPIDSKKLVQQLEFLGLIKA